MDDEVLKPEILHCLKDTQRRGAIPSREFGTQRCEWAKDCGFEVTIGGFGSVLEYGGCKKAIEARRAETGESPESSLCRALGRRVIDVEPRP